MKKYLGLEETRRELRAVFLKSMRIFYLNLFEYFTVLPLTNERIRDIIELSNIIL